MNLWCRCSGRVEQENLESKCVRPNLVVQEVTWENEMTVTSHWGIRQCYSDFKAHANLNSGSPLTFNLGLVNEQGS